MSANTETTGGPPKGYRPCRDNCGRYRHPACWRCWECYFARNPARREELAEQAKAEPDWTPPIAAPDFEHQALCRVERGGSCNCVPIAAPAAHVERRKGQVWRVKRDDQPAYETTLDARDCDGWFTVSSRGGGWIHDDCWGLPAYTMTLLDNATPEQAKLPGCTQCRIRGGDGLDESCDHAKSPSAQEAPKAAPEQFWFTDDEGEKIGPFATGLEADDASVAYGAWMRAQAGTPYAGPERLPRPQLAADWVEDCLPVGEFRFRRCAR